MFRRIFSSKPVRKVRMTKKSNRSSMSWEQAGDIKSELAQMIERLKFRHIDPERIVCFRSFGSKSRARARIWALPRVWQLALNIEPYYVIEVLSEKFDTLSHDDQKRVLIHELMHIPKTFSGALIPHRGRYHKINDATVEALFRKYSDK